MKGNYRLAQARAQSIEAENAALLDALAAPGKLPRKEEITQLVTAYNKTEEVQAARD